MDASPNEKNILDDSYLKVDQMYATSLATRIQEYRHPRLQGLREKTEVIVELTELQKSYAFEGSSKIDALVKNTKKAKKNLKEAEEEIQVFQMNNQTDSKKLYLFCLMLLGVVVALFTLNWLLSPSELQT